MTKKRKFRGIRVGDRVELKDAGQVVLSGVVIDDPEGAKPFKEANPGRKLVMVELDEPVYANGAFWGAMACFVDKLTRVR